MRKGEGIWQQNKMQFLIFSIALLFSLSLTNALTPPDIFRAGIAAPTELPSKFANDLKILSTKSSLNTFGFPSKVGEITKASPRHCKLTLTSILTCDDRQILESNPQPNPPTTTSCRRMGRNQRARGAEQTSPKQTRCRPLDRF